MNRRQLVLVVDTDHEILRMVMHILKLEGYDVIAADDSSSALALLEEHNPVLVILDIVIAKRNKFHVLNVIRQRSKIPVIILTGWNEVTSVRKALTLGADDYIKKPFRAHELAARVKAKLKPAEP